MLKADAMASVSNMMNFKHNFDALGQYFMQESIKNRNRHSSTGTQASLTEILQDINAIFETTRSFIRNDDYDWLI